MADPLGLPRRTDRWDEINAMTRKMADSEPEEWRGILRDHIAPRLDAKTAQGLFGVAASNSPQSPPTQARRRLVSSALTPVNRSNTPNMNTYVTPGGSIAAGYGAESGIDRMVAANQQQAMRNMGLMQGWGQGQLRLGGAKPEVADTRPLAPGLVGIDGQRVAPPSMSQYAGTKVGGTPVSASTQRAAQVQAARDLEMKQLMARRVARMTGRPLLPQFRGATEQPGQAMPAKQTVVVGSDGRVVQGQPTAATLSAAGTVNPSVATGAGQVAPAPPVTRMVPNPEFVNQHGARVSPFDMAGSSIGVPVNENTMGRQLQGFFRPTGAAEIGNSIGSWWHGIPSGPFSQPSYWGNLQRMLYGQ